MNLKYFSGIDNEKKLKNRYRKLCKKYHTDNGGDKEIFIEMDSEYNVLKKYFEMKTQIEGQLPKTENDEIEKEENLLDDALEILDSGSKFIDAVKQIIQIVKK